ncbi:MAG: hypothetical protein EBT06_12230 [Gammaproteobacteria bacterium]|nr:hypothetical protein [Gammaproteobacteria bacterium]NBT45655.1 hypothetical protein [Gammaproteobacteria bacterium]
MPVRKIFNAPEALTASKVLSQLQSARRQQEGFDWISRFNRQNHLRLFESPERERAPKRPFSVINKS